MARQYYKDSTTGQMKPIGVKVEDTLPVGTEVDYDGQDIPEGWEEVDDPNEYSTTETVVGTWLGKPLYRKVVEYANTTTIGNDSSTTNININHNISNLEKIVSVKGASSSGQILPRNDLQIPYYTTTTFQFQIINNTFGPRTWWFTLEYTKTSD